MLASRQARMAWVRWEGRRIPLLSHQESCSWCFIRLRNEQVSFISYSVWWATYSTSRIIVCLTLNEAVQKHRRRKRSRFVCERLRRMSYSQELVRLMKYAHSKLEIGFLLIRGSLEEVYRGTSLDRELGRERIFRKPFDYHYSKLCYLKLRVS